MGQLSATYRNEKNELIVPGTPEALRLVGEELWGQSRVFAERPTGLIPDEARDLAARVEAGMASLASYCTSLADELERYKGREDGEQVAREESRKHLDQGMKALRRRA